MPQETQQFGKYRLLRRIASGGMGEVHLAKLQGPNGFEKLLVIKRLLKERQGEQKFIDMFFSEARVAAQLGHSNVAQVYEVGTIDEVPYIAMEYVHGKSLRRVLDAAKERPTSAGSEQVPVALVAQIVSQLCLGLSFAHDARHSSGAPLGLIHRDINPHNVLISYRGEVKVIDFGIAKSELTWEKTQVGTIKGTVVYMSPEQSLGQKLDKRSDLFSVGIVLYEALSGVNPFHKGTLGASLDAIRAAQPPAISTLRPELVAFVPMLARVLTRTPDQRFEDCSALARALDALLASGMVPRAKVGLAAYMTELFAQDMLEEERALEATDMASVPQAVAAGNERATRVAPRPQAPPTTAPNADEEVEVEAGQSTLVTPNPLAADDEEAYPTRVEVVDLSRREPRHRPGAAVPARPQVRADRSGPEGEALHEATQVAAHPTEGTERTAAPEATVLANASAEPVAARSSVPAAEKRIPVPMAPLGSATVTPSPFGVMLRPLRPAWRRSTGALGQSTRALKDRLLARHPALAGWLVGAQETVGLRGGRFGLPVVLAGALLLGAGGTALWAAGSKKAGGTRLEVELPPPTEAASSVQAGGGTEAEPHAEAEAADGTNERPAGDAAAAPPGAPASTPRGRPGRAGARAEGAGDAHAWPVNDGTGRASPAPPEAATAPPARRPARRTIPAAAAVNLSVGAEPALPVRHNGRSENRAFHLRPGGGLIEFGGGPSADAFVVRVRYLVKGEEITYTLDATPWATVYGAGGIELGRTPLTWNHASPTSTFEFRNPHVRGAQTITLRVGDAP